LLGYLESALERGAVEVFICWEGDQAQPPERRLQYGLTQLSQTTTWLGELTFVAVASAQ